MILGRKIDYLSPTLYLTDILIVCLLCVYIATHKKFVSYKILLGYSAIATFSILTANQHEYAWYAWIKIAEYGLLSWYIISSLVSFATIAPALAAGIIYTSAVAIGQFVLQHSIGGVFWFLGERTFWVDTPGIARSSICDIWNHSCALMLRAYGTFSHPNVLGGFLSVTTPLIIWQFVQSKYSHLRYLYGIAIVLGFGALAVSLSRSAWIISIFVLTAVAFITTTTYKRRWQLGAVLFTCLVCIGFWIVQNISLHDESVVVRAQLNEAALSMWKQSPLVGVGIGNFLAALPSFLITKQIYFLQPVHNIYLLYIAETGLFGAAIFFLSIWVAIRTVKEWKHVVHSPIFYAFIGVLLLGLVDHYPVSLQQGQLLLVLLFAFVIASSHKNT
jgi:O-antigen ligase